MVTPSHCPDMDHGHPLGHLSPGKAAALTGRGRTTIMRAITAGELAAFRDNANNWQITVQALSDWTGIPIRKIVGIDRSMPPDTPKSAVDTPTDTPETLVRLAVAEARLADVTAERDRLALLLEKSLERRSWFERLLGR